MSLLAELQRRNVVRVGIFYLVSSWLLIQVADVLVGLFALPDWTLRLVGMILLLGLPVALVFSWVYELTPEGLRRDSGEAIDPGFSAATGKKLNTVTLVVAAIAIGLVAWQQFAGPSPTPGPADTPPEAASKGTHSATDDAAARTMGQDATRPATVTVAVLPFANLSANAENEYFADGVAEEVLNLLARSGDLRVISRSSAFSFKNQPLPIPEIADRLGATHVLEGSIRRAGDRVRITAQLIDAVDDVHLWSETFDRELVDVFAIQEQIARSIAQALEVNLASFGERRMAIDVYDMILEGRTATARRSDEEGLRRGVAILRETTAIAPENAEAWGQLALAQMLLVNWYDLDAPSMALVDEYAREALALDSDNVSALVALGAVETFTFEFELAQERFRRATALNPNSVDAANWYGDYLFIVGQYEQALEYEQRAATLDPLVAVHQLNLGFVESSLGRIDAALGAYERAVQLDPAFGTAQYRFVELALMSRRLHRLREFAARYGNSIDFPMDEMVQWADWLERGEVDRVLENARALSEEPYDMIFPLRVVYQDQSKALWDLVATRLEAVAKDGYPWYVWSMDYPTNPWILEQSERYELFWRTPPRDRLLRMRGHWIAGGTQ